MTNLKQWQPATAANAVAEEEESPQYRVAVAVTQQTRGTKQEPGDDVEDDNENEEFVPSIHPRVAHHNASIPHPHPNYSKIAHELYNGFASHWNNEGECSQLCKKSIVISRFLESFG
jgi:hypothetical protein